MARLPPFIALRALEAAARHRSYSRAAAELNVTHGAISQQIRRLEDEVGACLFTRQGNVMEPTAAAADLARHVSRAINILQAGVDALTEEAQVAPLVISVHSFAGLWLTRRLSRIPPEIGDIELSADMALANFVTDGVDAAIRHGSGTWPDVDSVHLFSEGWAPVASPAFLEKHPVTSLDDIARVPLVHHTEYPWSLWFGGLGLPTPALPRGPRFDDSAILLEAAVQGVGLALARARLVDTEVEAGRLVRPLPGEVQAAASYSFVWRADAPKLPRILKLRDWLLAEARQSRAEG